MKESIKMEEARIDYFQYNEKVDVIVPHLNKVVEGIVTSIRGTLLSVKTEEDEKIYRLSENLILKQWVPGRILQPFNRVDIKSKFNKIYFEGYLYDIDQSGVYCKYNIGNEEVQEFINHEEISSKLAIVGRFSSYFNPNKFCSSQINTMLYSNKNIFRPSEEFEQNFKDNIQKEYCIYETEGDGNCLYRAFAHQLYGNENLYLMVKDAILDYIEIEENFFSHFINGGKDSFIHYLNMKRCEGVWGDDIEIQACSELYKRPIQIFADSKVPIKTFHEDITNTRVNYSESNILSVITISYHGRSHYNSLVPMDISQFKANLLHLSPGEYEKQNLMMVKERKLKADDQSVKVFLAKEQMKKNIDDILNDKVTDHPDIPDHSEVDVMNDLKNAELETDLEYNYQEILNNAISESKYTQKTDYSETINFVVEMGFTLEEATLALSAVGPDPELMLQYLYSISHY